MKSSSSKSNKKRIVVLSSALVLVAVLVIAVLELTNTTHVLHKDPGLVVIPSNKSQNTSKESSSKTKSSDNSSSQSTSSNNTNTSPKMVNTAPSSQGATLIAPYGSFVSNHSPGKNGSPTTEQSVCSTTPGASCYMQFEKDGIIKKLDAKTADGSGSVVWDWDIKDAGFEAGSWKITAIATLNNETKKTVDPIGNLEIGS